MTLHCPTFATSWSMSYSRGEIKSRSWPPKQVKCSSTGRSTAIKRKPRKKPSGQQLSSTAHPPFSRIVSIILFNNSRTRHPTMASSKPGRAVGNAKAGSKHPSQSKSSVLLPSFSHPCFFQCYTHIYIGHPYPTIWTPFLYIEVSRP